jgi:hypothetical protein
MKARLLLSALALSLVSHAASAACVNRFVSRSERPQQIITLLTGKLTFQEAQALARAIQTKQSPPLEWIDDSGKVIARQYGELKVVRPMPVGCDGKTSGVVVIASFPAVSPPLRKMNVKFNEQMIVTFEQQAD